MTDTIDFISDDHRVLGFRGSFRQQQRGVMIDVNGAGTRKLQSTVGSYLVADTLRLNHELPVDSATKHLGHASTNLCLHRAVLCKIPGSFIRSEQNETRHTFSEFEAVEIDQKPDWYIEQLHVAQKLGYLNGQHFSHGLGLDQYTPLY